VALRHPRGPVIDPRCEPDYGLPFGAPMVFALSERDEQALADALRPGGTFCALLPPGSAAAALAWAVARGPHRPLVWITDGPKTLDGFFHDLQSLAGPHAPDLAFYPAWESLPGHGAPPPADLLGDRLETLQRLGSRRPPMLVATCVQALMQRTIAPDLLRAQTLELATGRELDLAALAPELEAAGFSFQTEVHQKGEVAVRGGILDLWPAVSAWPIRVELFGSAIESMRAFDPATQKSQFKVERLNLAPAREDPERLHGTLFDHVPAGAAWAWHERESIAHHAALYEEVIGEADGEAGTLDFDAVQAAVRRHGGPRVELVSAEERPGEAHRLDFEPVDGTPGLSGTAFQPDLLEEQRRQFVQRLNERARAGWQIHVRFGTTGALDRFREAYGPQLAPAGAYHVEAGALAEGFLCPPRRVLVLAEEDFYGRRKETRGRYDLHAPRPGPARKRGERIADWNDLQPGDFVVHVDHGIGKYLGLYEIEFNGQRQEVLTLEYAEKARLYLPVAQTHLLSRYVGVGKQRPQLHTLGGKRWQREKEAAQQAVQDLAAQLLQTQAARDALPGHAFGTDTPWQHEFEAAFPYKETPDQEQAIQDVKRDMESARPMDRLVCGDVGYGKTEVAMRAAFKAVMGGKQVALLVPTTVLAQQHYDTFCARMAAYPVRIEMLTRFQTRGEQADIVQRVNAGVVDIVIGTHRLLQGDLVFKDLGLVVVDEEQRFGVTHKEHFKSVRRMVDVLTLTATPIPRTLYMSLTGAKDLSTIETPPLERLPVETIVAQNTEETVREAVLRELNREGQVFYLHNRVRSIHHARDRLQHLVPEARIEVAHGQMNEHQLAAIMRAFVRAEFDVLMCTTIIESGLDIPNVNTILIERSDRFGLAELYQLRGRVGRYKRKAYAYFLLPRHGQLFDQARKRIGAIRRYSHLGAGFRLALRDLEIRGAGNMLGAAQSGHIASVGFDLYCQLLKRTVAALKGEPLPPVIDCELKLDFIDLSPLAAGASNAAVIPPGYVDDETLRLRLYRQIASAASIGELDHLERELVDRFGRAPAALTRLLVVARLRVAASGQGVRKLEVEGDKVVMTRHQDLYQPGGRFPRLKSAAPSAKLDELLRLVKHLP